MSSVYLPSLVIQSSTCTLNSWFAHDAIKIQKYELYKWYKVVSNVVQVCGLQCNNVLLPMCKDLRWLDQAFSK